MIGGDEASEGLGPRVDGAGDRAGEDEAVVDVGLGDAEGEGGVCGDGRVRGWAGGGDAAGVDGEEEVRAEGDGGVCDGGLAGEVEVAAISG